MLANDFNPSLDEIVLFKNCVEKFFKKDDPIGHLDDTTIDENGDFDVVRIKTNRSKDIEVTQEEFKELLRLNERTVCSRETIVVAYNADKTKLCFKKFHHTKTFVNVSGLNRRKFKINRSICGVTFDLVNKSVYSYSRIISKRIKSSSCRVNSFFGKSLELARSVEQFVHDDNRTKYFSNVLPLLNAELNLKINFTSLPEVMREFYLEKRCIDIVDYEKYYNQFFKVFKPEGNKFDNKNIYEIFADIIGVKNPDYIKLALELAYYRFKYDNKKGCNLNFTFLKLADYYQIPLDDLTNNNYQDRLLTDYSYERESIKVMSLHSNLSKIYKFSSDDILSFDQHSLYDMFTLLDTFSFFGYKLKFEHLETLNRRMSYYKMVLQLMYISAYTTGGVIFSDAIVKILQKSFTKKIRIKPLSNGHSLKDNIPKKLYAAPELDEDLVGKIGNSFVFRVVYNEKEHYYFSIDKFGSLTLSTFPKHISVCTKNEIERRLKSLTKRLDTNQNNILEKFDVNIRFSHEFFLDLCKSYKIDYNKYIEKI